ncbi:MAG: DUF5320 domain-containing protein, partial [Bacteroidales bacterium]
MPGFNHKGPEGKGPRTGRKLGKCKPAPGDNSTKDEIQENSLDNYLEDEAGNRRRFRNQGEFPGNSSGWRQGKFQGRPGGRGRG